MSDIIAVIGGSGVYQLPFLTVQKEEVIETPYGMPSSPIDIGQYEDCTVLFLARHGRAHQTLAHRVNYRANIWALAHFKPVAIVAVGSVGGISARAGSIVVPDQLIDYTSGRDNTFSEEHAKHIDFTHPFDRQLRDRILAAASRLSETVTSCAVYGVTNGPRLETAAEIQRLKRDGVDIVGMTAMPEAILARECDIPYAMICPVVNDAAGMDECADGIDLKVIHQRVEAMGVKISSIIQQVVSS